MNEAMEQDLRGPDKFDKKKVTYEKQGRQLYPNEPPPLEVHKSEHRSRPHGKENKGLLG